MPASDAGPGRVHAANSIQYPVTCPDTYDEFAEIISIHRSPSTFAPPAVERFAVC